jgi:formate hydrogenlyase subunit 3/multisubunit Na+/H+ antiporter MnhD subunit
MLLATGLVVVGAGSALSIAARAFVAGLAAQAAGIALVGIAGLVVLLSGETLGASFTNELEPRLGVDPTSGFFLFVLGLVGACSLVFATRYLAPDPAGRATALLTGVFLLVLVLVVCARDPLTFLFGWELMTLVPAGIILVGRHDRESRSSVYTYLAVTHLFGVGTWVAVLLLADVGAFGGGSPVETGSGTQIAIALAALVGMGAKAGLVPLHIWLPRAHPIAPAHVSALMSGVMIKLAIYGLARALVVALGVLRAWIGGVVLGLGAVAAVVGVVYAIFQHELKRLLAFHSIENVGIIVLGLGACLVLRTRGADEWASIALAAALLHTLNHAVFKGLLFLGAGAFERAVGSLEIDRLGGLLRRMPWTGGAFLVGAMAIAGLPPLNGFASEWLTLQSLLSVPANGGVGTGLAGALALGALAATAALAVLCFVKVVGLVLLGPPRRPRVGEAVESPAAMRVAVGVLAALREREVTGRGRHVSVALFDASVAAMVNQAANYLIGGVVPERMGTAHPNIVPYQSFHANDRPFILAAGNDRLFARTCEVLGHASWADDVRFATNEARVIHRDELIALLADALAQRSMHEWLALLDDAGVPCAPILAMDEVFSSSDGAGLVDRVDDPVRGLLRLVANPIRFDGVAPPTRTPPPLLGEHDAEVRRDLELGTDP